MTKYKVGDIVTVLPITVEILDSEGPDLSEDESMAPLPNPILLDEMREWIHLKCIVIELNNSGNFFRLEPLNNNDDIDTYIWWADWQVTSSTKASIMETE